MEPTNVYVLVRAGVEGVYGVVDNLEDAQKFMKDGLTVGQTNSYVTCMVNWRYGMPRQWNNSL